MSIIEKALDKMGSAESGKPGKKPGSDPSERKSPDVSTNEPEKPGAQSPETKRSESIILDLEGLGKSGYLTPNTENKILFEQFRRIKLPVIKTAFESEDEKNNNIVIVTSSVTGEGKSFTSLNLAMSVAYEYNYTVLLIDADITKKMSSKVMGVEGARGLIDYLTGKESQLDRLILKTNIPKLNLISSGGFTDMVTELYSSKKMTKLINELSVRYHDRLIIIDTPPILEDSSAKVLANLADQILYIVEAEKTPKHVVEKGLRLLDHDNIGIVLNKSNVKHHPSYYYYV